MESPCECDIEPPGSISHGISQPTANRALEGFRRRWESNNRMELKEIGANERNCVDYVQERYSLRAPFEFGIESPGSIKHMSVNLQERDL